MDTTKIAELEDLFRRIDNHLREAVIPCGSPEPKVRAAHLETAAAKLDGLISLKGREVLWLAQIAKCALGMARGQELSLDDHRENAPSATKAWLVRNAREDKQARLRWLVEALTRCPDGGL